MGNFEYTTIDEQIKKLKSQHLIFKDEAFAKTMLQTYGYYNIINGYRDPYIIRSYDKKYYSSNVSFEQLFALFTLDHFIRNTVMTSMIDLEEHLRAVVADIIGESFGSDHHDYLAKNNYRDRRVNNPKFSRQKILSTLTDLAENSYKEPIKYYRNTHHIIPPWILLKGTDFGTLVNYIRLFKSPQRDKLIHLLYPSKIDESNIDKYKDLLSDTLSLCLEYRNIAAHGGRIYNYIPTSNIRGIDQRVSSGLSTLIYCLSHFRYRQPNAFLDRTIHEAVARYCYDYFDDIPRLENAIGFKIEIKKTVWLNEKTNVFHSNHHCSGGASFKRITTDQIDESFMKPCAKCMAQSK